MYYSTFSYNLTRPYPYKWITPTIYLGGVVAALLFSMVNIVTTGYDMVATSSSDFSATLEQEKTWFSNWPSFFSKATKPKCEPTILVKGAMVQTNNTALEYSITDIWDNNGILSTTVYQGNPLQCQVDLIRLEIAPIQISPGNSSIYTVIGTVGITCDILGGDNGISFSLLTEYGNKYGLRHGIPDIYTIRPALVPNFGNRSVSWGLALLALAQNKIEANLNGLDSNGTDAYDLGLFDSTPRNSINLTSSATIVLFPIVPANAEHPLSPGEWYIACPGFTYSSTSPILLKPDCPNQVFLTAWTHESQSFFDYAEGLDRFAKLLYYTTLTDLGPQAWFLKHLDESPNILADPNLLVSFAPKHDTKIRASDLTVYQSTIAATYLCQIPKIKSTGSLIVSVLIADLVFLQALWKIFTLTVGCFMIRRHPELRLCERCNSTIDGHADGEKTYESDTGSRSGISVQTQEVGKPKLVARDAGYSRLRERDYSESQRW